MYNENFSCYNSEQFRVTVFLLANNNNIEIYLP